ncbi:MAG: hypothetical protein HFJ24_07660 [Clostridia bacterium]|nr:hypothetical protein [Clostridia bacterium]
MKYYFIYSAGGGAGDWNGIKRVWKEDMPEKLKSNILLKFGDIFFNHKSSTSILRKQRWNNITNIREWLYENVKDEYVLNNSDIILDSGTAKIVSFIDHNYNLGSLDTEQIIEHFINIIDNNAVLEKYADIIVKSKIDLAVCFDIPDPFKVRSNNEVVERRRNILDKDKEIELMDVSVLYTNKLYNILKEKTDEKSAVDVLMPIVNGQWNKEQFDRFLSKLEFIPKNIAIGGISGSGYRIDNLKLNEFELERFKRVHFLGCGGLSKTKDFKQTFDGDEYSVDVSTPINRAIDGATSGKSFSGIYSYNDFEFYRINEHTKNEIINDYEKWKGDKIFSLEEFKSIMNSILEHQSGKSNEETYNNRARLIILNSDVFRYNAEL